MSKPLPDNEKFFRMTVIVEGSRDFPIDMLRYDRCCPATEHDAHVINHKGPRQVKLLRFSQAGKSGPHIDRWRSFGWKVVEVEYPDGKKETA